MTHENAWRTCVLSLTAALMLAAADRAVAQVPSGCTAEITSLPYTINSSGTYCLKNTMFTSLPSGAAITIGSATAATIDLRGFAIINVATGGSAVGVHGNGKSSVTVRNGRIQGFWVGVNFDITASSTSSGNTVENVHVDLARERGIVMYGFGQQVRNCTVTRYGEGSAVVSGIWVRGEGSLVEGNLVARSLSVNGRGIWATGDNHEIVGNRVINPITYGILIDEPTTEYRDNLVTGAFIPYSGGTDAGNNQ